MRPFETWPHAFELNELTTSLLPSYSAFFCRRRLTTCRSGDSAQYMKDIRSGWHGQEMYVLPSMVLNAYSLLSC